MAAAKSSHPHRWTYDVFVSFRGEDIRKSFMDHLFSDFKRKGIHAFRDDTQLPRGEDISSQLYRAIEESRFLIVIFSKHYASSSWCLKELVKILDCKQMGKYEYQVRIIFYDIRPDVVKNQTGSYAEAFTRHEFSKKLEVPKWKEALKMAANLSGWDLQDMTNGFEAKFIDIISKHIFQKLCEGPLHVGENLVGLDARINNMKLLRFVGSSKVQMIGICGIGGIGKTTLAKAIYNLMYIHFEACSFCEDVQGVTKQHGLAHSLKQVADDIMGRGDPMIRSLGEGVAVIKRRLASRRILVVLDGVDHPDQLEALAGSRNWFFRGSLIVITSKDKQLLRAHQVDEIFDIEFLNDDEALELFMLYAFREKIPTQDFKEQADEVVKYVQGHPLALKVLGCFLYGKTLSEWKSELNRLHTYPNAQIQQVLRLSYDGLDIDQKRILLDIACSLKGENKNLAAHVLDSCGLFADTNIRVLVDKSLVTISTTMSLQMHDLIQRMAWEIVRDESKKPGERSRLWIPEEVCDVLNKDKVTDAVEVLVLSLDKSSKKVVVDGKAFARMNNLRILKICDLELEDFGSRLEFNLSNDSKVDLSGSFEFLSNELRLLYWHGYPFKSLPAAFYPENIVAIDMSYSHINQVWTKPTCFKKLKSMKLRHCHNLRSTPDFTGITNLEELHLEGCLKLVEVHPSLAILKRLIVLNLRNCISLRSLPCSIELETLRILILSGCKKLDKLPVDLGTIKTLVELLVDGTAIKQIPSCVLFLSNLEVFSIGRRKGFRSSRSKWWTSIFQPSSLLRKVHHAPSLVLPNLISLRLLRHLDVSHCNISDVSINNIGSLSCLEHLNLSGNTFTSLPASLSQLSRLSMLGLVGCKSLQVLPELPPSLSYFDAMDCTSLCELQKQPIMYSSRNQSLDFTNCPKLVENHTVESLLSMMLPQGRMDLSDQLDIVLQGSSIPRWFSNQSDGNCVKVELPPACCYEKYRGYGTCVVLAPKNPNTSEGWYGQIGYDLINSDGDHIGLTNVTLVSNFPNEEIGVVGSNLIWLHYEKAGRHPNLFKNYLNVSFRGSAYVEVKRCGVRLVCDEDVQQEEESSLRMIQGPSPSNSNQEEPPTKKSRLV